MWPIGIGLSSDAFFLYPRLHVRPLADVKDILEILDVFARGC